MNLQKPIDLDRTNLHSHVHDLSHHIYCSTNHFSREKADYGRDLSHFPISEMRSN